MEKKEKIEFYTLKPSLKQYYGRRVNKSLKFDEWTEDKKVHQTLENLKLTTEIHETKNIKLLVNGEEKTIKMEETSTIVQTLVTGIVLLWDELQGYIIPNYQMSTLDEIEEDLKAMKKAYNEVYNDTKRNENKNI